MSEAPPHALLRARVAVPFLTIALIWGSTWFVITGQIAHAAPTWSVVWRFAPATLGALLIVAARRDSLRFGLAIHARCVAIGLFQFCGNYILVYHAEQHLTSGIVAVMSSLLIVPNAVLGRLVLSERMTPRFIVGSLIAVAGIAILLVHEAQAAALGRNIPAGVAMALAAMLSASFASVIQASPACRQVPMASLMAFSMLYGTLLDAAFAFLLEGAPAVPTGAAFWLGTLYLAIMGSVVTFPLYWGLVREIGPGRAAYHGVLVVVIAMGLSTLFEHYVWSALAIWGAALSLVGLLVALRARNPLK